jgi:hypothetical protein
LANASITARLGCAFLNGYPDGDTKLSFGDFFDRVLPSIGREADQFSAPSLGDYRDAPMGKGYMKGKINQLVFAPSPAAADKI